jgi:peptide-methionine (R)-S-oxide reductase
MREESMDLPRTEEEWQAKLTAQQYEVLRCSATEPPFSGRYVHTKDKGTYRCAACGAELFSSEAKFDSGTGWPSFTEPADQAGVELSTDTSHGMVRTEVRCRRCGSHLGHLFDDGPFPSGNRYCINSAALNLEQAPGEKP